MMIRRPRRQPLREIERLDQAVYDAIAASKTPSLDRALSTLSNAADYSRLSLTAAAGLALFGGGQGRRAAVRGAASLAVTATIVNAAIKPAMRRRRPERGPGPAVRHVRMPRSTSFPSGHSAAAFAFATGAGQAMPLSAIPLTTLAGLVAYSRVHTGVHFPGDVLAGSLCGIVLASITNALLDRHGIAPPPTRERSSAWAS